MKLIMPDGETFEHLREVSFYPVAMSSVISIELEFEDGKLASIDIRNMEGLTITP